MSSRKSRKHRQKRISATEEVLVKEEETDREVRRWTRRTPLGRLSHAHQEASLPESRVGARQMTAQRKDFKYGDPCSIC